MQMAGGMLDKQQYRMLSEFRHAMAGFLQFSQQTTHAAGLTPAQYQMLLHLQGFPGRDWATISELAERMQASHPATAALVKRAQQIGLVTKQRGREDGRCVEIHATPHARELIARVAGSHADELARLRGVFAAATSIRPAKR